jgi:purine-nucleoside phosphorylase
MNAENYMKKVHAAADMIRERCGEAEIGVILGSGLGDYINALEDATSVSYEDIPGFPVSTAPFHEGRWFCGKLYGKRVCMMQERFHSYEGYDFEQLVIPVRLFQLLGAKALILTNAAGAVNTAFEVGDIMLITDHIKLFAMSPLTGPNVEEFGPRFPDMTHAYTPALQEVANRAAKELGIRLQEGVYMYFPGPQYETPAEIRAARLLGADAVGMSTVPEVITAGHCGMKVLGFTLCTNMAAGVLDQPLTGEEVIEAGKVAAPRFSALVKACLAQV